MHDPLRILHVTAPGEFGGLERVVATLAPGQAAAGHRVVVLAVVDRNGGSRHPLRGLPHGSGVDVCVMPVPPRAYLRERRAVEQVLASERPSVVHTHGYRPDVVDSGVARAAGYPTVTTVHGFTGGDRKNRLYERLQRRAHRHFDAVVAVSRPLARRLEAEGVPGGKIRVVRNRWAGDSGLLPRPMARRELQCPDGDFHVGWVGRLSDEKGPDVLLEAVARMDGFPVCASFVGSGRAARRLRQRARSRGVSERLTWHGALPDAARYFPAFDAFVLSSRSEGTPMVLFEAMAARVPIVATRVGGVSDIVSEREAILVPPDDPAALAEAIQQVASKPEEARTRARAARARLEKEFGMEGWRRDYDEVYRSILPSPPAVLAP